MLDHAGAVGCTGKRFGGTDHYWYKYQALFLSFVLISCFGDKCANLLPQVRVYTTLRGAHRKGFGILGKEGRNLAFYGLRG